MYKNQIALALAGADGLALLFQIRKLRSLKGFEIPGASWVGPTVQVSNTIQGNILSPQVQQKSWPDRDSEGTCGFRKIPALEAFSVKEGAG